MKGVCKIELFINDFILSLGKGECTGKQQFMGTLIKFSS